MNVWLKIAAVSLVALACGRPRELLRVATPAEDFFAVALPPARALAEREIILWPDNRNLVLLIDCDFRDTRGEVMLPVIQLQYQSWTDSLATEWFALSLAEGEYYVSRDTVIILPERIRHVGLERGMLNLRARLESRRFYTGWVRLPAAVQFYPAGERGVPKQPAFLKLVQ